MLEQGNVVWVKGLLVMNQKKLVVISMNDKDKKHEVYEKRKGFDGTYGGNTEKVKRKV